MKRISRLIAIACVISIVMSSITKTGSTETIPTKKIKILVLIIATDNDVFPRFQQSWRFYMHRDREYVEAYFVKGNPNLPTQCSIQDDVIWACTPENYNPGMINKTVLAMEALLPRIQEFDYILRTNLSSFYVFPRLLKFLENCPKNKFYCGYDITEFGNRFASGSGYIISSDIMELIVKNKNFFLNNTSMYEDVLVGDFLIKQQRIQLIPEKWFNFSPNSWDKCKNNLPEDVYHFRTKTESSVRRDEDLFIHSQLLKIFYDNDKLS